MPALYQPGQSIDHSTILHLLGQGRANHMYLARDQQTHQEVVLKFPYLEEIGNARMFASNPREIAEGSRLSHPLIQRHLNQGEERNSGLSPKLATIVMRAIRRNPRKRYASTRELLRDLNFVEEVIPGEYVPDSPLLGGRFRQAWRIVLVVFVCLVVILAFGFLAQFAHQLCIREKGAGI